MKQFFVGRRLATRDGRKIGNAIITEGFFGGGRWKIETDFGNRLTMTEPELLEAFYCDHIDAVEAALEHDHNLELWREQRLDSILTNDGVP